MYRLLKYEDFNPVFSTFYKKLQKYRNAYFLTRNFDNLTRTEIEILLCIANDNFPNNAKWIAKYLNVSKALVSQNIDSLVTNGYIERTINTEDKRWHILSLGERSTPLSGNLFLLAEDFNRAINKDITYEEMKAFTDVLKKMARNLDEATQEVKEQLKNIVSVK